MPLNRSRFIAVAILVLALSLSVDAYARAGFGGSFGSRGSRTFTLPPVTRTAPRPSEPLGWSGAPTRQSPSLTPSQPPGGFFSGGFGRGFLGGLLGAGLFGLLFGNGLFGGLGTGISLLGLILQIGLLVLAVRFVLWLVRSRATVPAFNAGAARGGSAMGGGGLGFSRNTASALRIEPADFDAFQQRLCEIQAAYSAEDVDRLGRLATTEVASRMADDIASNVRRGVINRVSDVRLLQGDLAEAWREGDTEFATVAMRFSLIDTMADRATGRIVSGSPGEPQEAVEVWTFARPAGGGPADWKLSAIQQA